MPSWLDWRIQAARWPEQKGLPQLSFGTQTLPGALNSVKCNSLVGLFQERKNLSSHLMPGSTGQHWHRHAACAVLSGFPGCDISGLFPAEQRCLWAGLDPPAGCRLRMEVSEVTEITLQCPGLHWQSQPVPACCPRPRPLVLLPV